MKTQLKLAIASVVLGLSVSAFAASNTNTTIQEGDVNTNKSTQKGNGVNDNATYQKGKDNYNVNKQRGRGDNVNSTGQFGVGPGSQNYNKNSQKEGRDNR